jgi:hypothetical protein
MTVLREGNLEIRLPVNAIGRRFDGDDHGLSHCMKAVDFVVELPDRIYFIEVKNPDQSQSEERKTAYSLELSSGRIDEELKTKFRDTWLYEWAERRTTKPVYYLVLIAFDRLTAAELSVRKSGISRKLPVLGPENRPWGRAFVRGCAVLNVTAWNRMLQDMPVRLI